MRLAIAFIVASLLSSPAAAQKFGGSTFRPAPAPVYRAPSPAPVTTRAPTPAPAYRAPAPVTQPVRSYAQVTTPKAKVSRATGTTAKPVARNPRTKAPGIAIPMRAGSAPAAHRTVNRTAPAKRRAISIRGHSYSWIAPAAMPIWWMGAMHQPYSFLSYDSFIERCLRTPERDRSKECIRALRERGLAD